MSCARNNILTAELLTNPNTREAFVSLSKELEKFKGADAYGLEASVRRGFLEDEMSSLMMQNVLAGTASPQAKLALLNKFERNFSKYGTNAQEVRVSFLKGLDNADQSINGNMATNVLKYVDSNNWNKTLTDAKSAIEKSLVFDYINIPESSAQLYKKLIKDGSLDPDLASNTQAQLRDYLLGLSDEELNNSLKGNKIYKALSKVTEQSISIEDKGVSAISKTIQNIKSSLAKTAIKIQEAQASLNDVGSTKLNTDSSDLLYNTDASDIKYLGVPGGNKGGKATNKKILDILYSSTSTKKKEGADLMKQKARQDFFTQRGVNFSKAKENLKQWIVDNDISFADFLSSNLVISKSDFDYIFGKEIKSKTPVLDEKLIKDKIAKYNEEVDSLNKSLKEQETKLEEQYNISQDEYNSLYNSKSDSINEFIAVSSMLGGDKVEIAEALKAVRESKFPIPKDEIIRVMNSVQSLPDFKKFIINNINTLASHSDNIAQDITKKVDELVLGATNDEQMIANGLLSKMSEPDSTFIDPSEALQNLDQVNERADLGMYNALNALNKIVNKQDKDKLLNGISISDQEIERIIGIKNADELKAEIKNLIKDSYDSLNKNKAKLKEKLNKEIKEIDDMKIDPNGSLTKEQKDLLQSRARKQSSLDNLNNVDQTGLEETFKSDPINKSKKLSSALLKIKEISNNRSNTLILDNPNKDGGATLLKYLTYGYQNYNKVTSEGGLNDLSKVGFLKQERSPLDYAGKDEVEKRLYSEAYKTNAIKVGEVKVYNTAEEAKNAIEKGEINTLVLASKDDLVRPGVESLIAKSKADILTPTSPTLVGGFFEENGTLKYTSTNNKYIKNLRDKLADLNIRSLIENEGRDAGKIANDILKLRNGLQEEEIPAILKELGIGNKYSFYQIRNKRDIVSKVNKNYRKDILDPAELKDGLMNQTEESVKELLRKKFVDLNREYGSDITEDEITKAIEAIGSKEKTINYYLSSTIGKDRVSISQGEIDLLSTARQGLFFDSITQKIKSKTDKNVLYFNALNNIGKKYNLPFKTNYEETFERIGKGMLPTEKTLAEFRIANDLESNTEAIKILTDGYKDALSKAIPSVDSPKGKGNYLIKDVDSYNGYKLPTPTEATEKMINKGTKKFVKDSEELLDGVQKILQSYEEEVIKSFEGKSTITDLQKDTMKSKAIKSIRDLENAREAKNLETSGFSDNRTYVFSINGITDSDSIPRFQKDMDDVAFKYKTNIERDIEEYKSILEKGANLEGEKASEVFKNAEARPVLTPSGDVALITKQDEIDQAINELPDGFDELQVFKGANLSNLSPSEKYDLLEAIKEVKVQALRKNGIVETIMRQYDPSLARELERMKNVLVVVNKKPEYLPGLLVSKNSSELIKDGTLNTVLDRNQDLSAKLEIYKDISKALSEGKILMAVNDEKKGFTGIKEMAVGAISRDISSIPSDRLKELGYEGNLAGLIDDIASNYTSDFMFYAKLPKVTDDMIFDAKEIMNKSNDISAKSRDILNQITYTDLNGNQAPLMNKLDALQEKYPDIIYRNQERVNASDVGGRSLSPIEREDLKRGVARQLDMTEHGFLIEEGMDNNIWQNMSNNALQAMQRSPRMKKLSTTIFKTLETGKIAEAGLSRTKSYKNKVRNALAYAFVKSESYDPAFVQVVADKYKEYMSMLVKEIINENGEKVTVNEFQDVIKNTNGQGLSNEELAAYNLANHYRSVRDYTKGLSNDVNFNNEVYAGYSNLFDNITEVVNGQVVFKGDKEGHIANIARSLNRGNIFYGIDAFKKRGFEYKIEKNVFGPDKYGDPTALETFNTLFNSNYDMYNYRTMMGALVGDMINTDYGSGTANWVIKQLSKVRRFAASPAMRFFSSMPGTLLSGITSSLGYIKNIENFKKNNLDFNMDGAAEFIRNAGILTSAGADFSNIDRILGVNKLNRINPIAGLREDMPRIFGKPIGDTQLYLQTIDNGQNLYDGVFSETMKVNAFVSSLKGEGFLSVDDFKSVVNDPEIPKEYRQALYDRVVAKTYEGHEGMINYVGSDLTKRMENGSWWSKAVGFMNMVINPINFRGSLGMNLLSNAKDNAFKIIEYGNRYGWSQEAFDAIAKDPVIKNWIFSWFRDTMMALKTANANNQGETSNESTTDVSDFFTVFKALSQNRQIMNTAGPMRVLMAAAEEKDYPAIAALSSYVQNLFKDMTSATTLVDAAVALAGGGLDELAAYVFNNYENRSTGGIRYTGGYIPGVVFHRGKGINTIIGGDNDYLDLYYGKSRAELSERFKRLFDGEETTIDGVKTNEVKDFFNTLLGINKLYKTAKNIVNGKDYRVGDPNEVIDEFFVDEIGKEYGRTGQFPLSALASMDEKDVKYIMEKLTLNFVPGSSDRADYAKSHLDDDGGKVLSSNGTYYIEERADGMDQLMDIMKNDGNNTLQKLYDIQQNTNNKKRTEKEVSDFMVSYIDNLSDDQKKTIPNWDGLMLQISNSVELPEDVKDQTSEYKKSNKKMNDKGRMVQGDIGDGEKLNIQKRFIEEHLPAMESRYADTTLDGNTFSNLGLDLASYFIARKKGVLQEPSEYYTTKEVKDTNGGVKYNITGLKPQRLQRIKKVNYFQNAIKAGKPLSQIAETTNGVFNVFPTMSSTKDGLKYDTELIMKQAMYIKRFSENLDMDPTKRAEMQAANLAFLGDKVLPIAEIRKFSPEFADDVAKHRYQTYKDTVKLAHDSIEGGDGKGKGGGGRGRKGSINVSALSDNLAKIKKYVSENAGEIYKPFSLVPKAISPYSLTPETVGSRALKTPSLPTLSAKSAKLFKAVKAKAVAIDTKPSKTKKVSFNINQGSGGTKKKKSKS